MKFQFDFLLIIIILHSLIFIWNNGTNTGKLRVSEKLEGVHEKILQKKQNQRWNRWIFHSDQNSNSIRSSVQNVKFYPKTQLPNPFWFGWNLLGGELTQSFSLVLSYDQWTEEFTYWKFRNFFIWHRIKINGTNWRKSSKTKPRVSSNTNQSSWSIKNLPKIVTGTRNKLNYWLKLSSITYFYSDNTKKATSGTILPGNFTHFLMIVTSDPENSAVNDGSTIWIPIKKGNFLPDF